MRCREAHPPFDCTNACLGCNSCCLALRAPWYANRLRMMSDYEVTLVNDNSKYFHPQPILMASHAGDLQGKETG